MNNTLKSSDTPNAWGNFDITNTLTGKIVGEWEKNEDTGRWCEVLYAEHDGDVTTRRWYANRQY